MPNIVTRIALVLAVLALPSAVLARGAGGGMAGGGAAALASRGAILGSAMNYGQMHGPAVPSVVPIPPPRITVPPIPQFK